MRLPIVDRGVRRSGQRSRKSLALFMLGNRLTIFPESDWQFRMQQPIEREREPFTKFNSKKASRWMSEFRIVCSTAKISQTKTQKEGYVFTRKTSMTSSATAHTDEIRTARSHDRDIGFDSRSPPQIKSAGGFLFFVTSVRRSSSHAHKLARGRSVAS